MANSGMHMRGDIGRPPFIIPFVTWNLHPIPALHRSLSLCPWCWHWERLAGPASLLPPSPAFHSCCTSSPAKFSVSASGESNLQQFPHSGLFIHLSPGQILVFRLEPWYLCTTQPEAHSWPTMSTKASRVCCPGVSIILVKGFTWGPGGKWHLCLEFLATGPSYTTLSNTWNMPELCFGLLPTKCIFQLINLFI